MNSSGVNPTGKSAALQPHVPVWLIVLEIAFAGVLLYFTSHDLEVPLENQWALASNSPAIVIEIPLATAAFFDNSIPESPGIRTDVNLDGITN